ncbi:hypothetical protein L1049_000481 [Liquidambar formosana]|uniref:Uncharacterized protein n=1 Tax=Liquidambar formosana TaxID=63359 RepID=A0AAP0N925_LIQFO
MELLNLRILPFVRFDLLQISLTQGLSLDKRYMNWTLRVASVHGQKAPLPFIKSVEVSFLDSENYKAAILNKQPFQLKRRTVLTKEFEMVLKLNFSDGCGCLCTEIKIPVDFKVSTNNFNRDEDAIIRRLKDEAVRDACCGQNAIVERKTVLAPKSEVTVYAIVTNIVRYHKTSKAFEATSVCNGDAVKRRNEGVNGIEVLSWKRLKGRKRKSRS